MLRFVLIFIVLLAAAFLLLVGFAVPEADRRFNRVVQPPPYDADAEARRLHGALLVADLHADFLLWKRDLLKRYERGHVDLPRMAEGRLGLQVFSVVTKSPRGQNYERNEASSDRITLLAVAQGWPLRAWRSLRERALHQARRLHRMAERSDGRLSVLRTAGDLDSFLRHRQSEPEAVAGLLALEGLHPLEGRLENVDLFFDAGFRMMAPVHMFDNEVAGSAHGAEQYGLTELGHKVVGRMEELGVIIDLAHASSRTIEDVLAVSTRPVVVSHTGVRATCDSPRNLSDDQISAIAATGGVVGVGLWDRAVCGTEVEDVVRAIRHAVDVAGIDHVALGSDFDGTVRTMFDASGMVLLTEGLQQNGFTDDEIRKIMGGNVLRLLQQSLPPGEE